MKLFGLVRKPTGKKRRFFFKIRNSEWPLQESVKWVTKKHTSNFSTTGIRFHKAIGFALRIAAIFSIFPVSGASSNQVSDIKFKWISIKTFYSLIVLSLSLGYLYLTGRRAVKYDINFDLMTTTIFYTSSACGLYLFLRLASKWPELMQQWETVDAALPKWRQSTQNRRLAIRIKLLTVIVLTCASIEHMLSILQTILFATVCLNRTQTLEEYARVESVQLFEVFEYSIWWAVLGKMLNIIATFVWNFMDLFIMLISVGLASMFKRINEDLRRVQGENMNEDFWESRRLQYRSLSKLCAAVDTAISSIILVSFLNNLFFICIQLLKSLTPMPMTIQAVYFWYSLTFLIGRTVAVSLYSAEIHEESKKPIIVLRAAPNISWSMEAQRLFEHVSNGNIALSGIRFFFITRRLIPSIAKTIVTYALVLIQFRYEDTKKKIVCGR